MTKKNRAEARARANREAGVTKRARKSVETPATEPGTPGGGTSAESEAAAFGDRVETGTFGGGSAEVGNTVQKVVDEGNGAVVTSGTSIGISGAAIELSASGENKMTQLNLVRVKPNGSAVYSIPGVAGTVRIAKAVFGGNEPPQTIEVASTGLAQMNPEKAEKLRQKAERRANAATNAQSRLEKLQARAAKQSERAKKAEERLAKAQARAAKLAEKAGTPGVVTGAAEASETAAEEVAAN